MGWTSTSSTLTGTWGTCDSNVAAWSTSGTATACNGLANGRLYCFEQ